MRRRCRYGCRRERQKDHCSMTEKVQEPISRGRRLRMLAKEHPDKPAVIFVKLDRREYVTTWRQLEAGSNRLARHFADCGVDENSTVVIGLRNSPEHYYVAFAAWKLGAMTVPLRWDMPKHERDAVLALADPALVVADWDGSPYRSMTAAELSAADSLSSDPLPDKISNPGVASTSGGSTGRPKVIVNNEPLSGVPGKYYAAHGIAYYTGMRGNQIQIVTGPLYHGAPFGWGHAGLFEAHTLIVTESWNTELVAELIEKHRVSFMFMVPTMLIRLAKLPNFKDYDFSCIEGLFHAGAKCPEWVKYAWIEKIGGEKVYECFGSTELCGFTAIRGDEWLEHPGSVGRPIYSDLKILDDEQNELPTGEVGEIYFRFHAPRKPTFAYIGSPYPKTTPDGFTSVGDLGWVDEAGYLYSADRRIDMIVTGGANVFPAEVEAALHAHPAVADVVALGIPDPEWGRRVHAVVQPVDRAAAPSAQELDKFCRERLMVYKTPKSYEFLPELPRDGMGKIRRNKMLEDRLGDWQGEIEMVKPT